MSAAEKLATPPEHPILFRPDMVRAILEGRKTQTRRPVRLPDHSAVARIVPSDGARGLYDCQRTDGVTVPYTSMACPWGVPGDTLWVRETWRPAGQFGFETIFQADEEWHANAGWKPSIHMHRYRARLFLENAGVRVQRLQDIGEEDARAEGFVSRDGFAARSSLGWDANPWVWVINFRRLP